MGIIDDLYEFCTRWSLNDQAQDKLISLSREVMMVLVRDFSPKVEPGGDVNGKFFVFARGIEQRIGSAVSNNVAPTSAMPQRKRIREDWEQDASAWMQGRVAVPMVAASAPADDPVQTFINQWGLNEDSVRVIESMPPEVVEVVVRDFSPRGEDGDWNGKFIKFAANVMKRLVPGSGHKGKGKGLNDPLDNFIMRWNLNGDGQAKLRQLALHPTALEIVMSEFKAPPGDREVNGMFIRFASSVQKRLGLI
eukprot:TRINITY_DN65274_c0_g1_i1.p1 TRINITY_DN65274_c0_g1~~TRINITY_DN65274_c0_g1_i1.p1  ORF type:complete len:250 (-),score=52.70 TRINITY_DN65274_c0_g1_i1:284-1033(-)